MKTNTFQIKFDQNRLKRNFYTVNNFFLFREFLIFHFGMKWSGFVERGSVVRVSQQHSQKGLQSVCMLVYVCICMCMCLCMCVSAVTDEQSVVCMSRRWKSRRGEGLGPQTHPGQGPEQAPLFLPLWPWTHPNTEQGNMT